MWPWNKPTPAQPVLETKAAPPTDPAAITNAMPDAALLVMANGHVGHANRKAVELLGRGLAGQHVSAAIRAPLVLETIGRVERTGEAEAVGFERRGQVRQYYEAWIAPIRPAAPMGPALLIIIKDLTRAQLVERMRADFVANASHELRTPLTAVLGFIDTLQGPAREDAGARDRFLDMMRQQGQRMKRLIDELLTLNRIEMNESRQPEAVEDLGKLARQVAETMGPLARQAGVEIHLDLTLDVLVRADRDELAQVLQNLAENALKYAASGKRIVIRVARGDEGAEASVQDFGPGIAAEHLPRLTERFYRVDVQESRARGGTGLGLAIVKHIVGRHRGKLRVQSEPGVGSTFTVTLPLVEKP